MNTKTLSYILFSGCLLLAVTMIMNGITMNEISKDSNFGKDSNTYKMNIASIIFIGISFAVYLILGIILFKKTEGIPIPEL